MKKTLYLRIILAYILFGLFGFFSVATIISRLTTEYCVRDKARLLYGEASRISDTYALQLYKSKVSLEEVQAQMEALSSYMDTEIWILNPSGRMVVNSKQAPDPEQETFVEDFDSTITAGNYYTTGTFFDSFENDVLSVIAPITSDFKIRGYVVIHLPMESIRADANGMLNISYMLLVILIVLSLIILLFFTEYVYRPLNNTPSATCTILFRLNAKMNSVICPPPSAIWRRPSPERKTIRKSLSQMYPTISVRRSPQCGAFSRLCWTAPFRRTDMNTISKSFWERLNVSPS